MTKILVTGGLGFIGSNFIKHILNKYPNYSVINLDKVSYCANPDNLKEFRNDSRYTLVRGDICDPLLMDDLVRKVDYVVNFAAESHVDKSFHAPLEFTRTNVLGAHNVVEMVRKHKNVKKMLHIGTDEVYGSLSHDAPSSTEKDKIFPRNPYSATKAGADMIMKAYQITYDVPVLISRSSNNFGPLQFPEKLVPMCTTNALLNQQLRIHGTGEYYRDWLFVGDNCSALDLVMHEGEIGEIYNVGGSQEVKVIDIAKMILKILGKPESLLTFVKNRPSQDLRYSLSSEKVKTLGWKPSMGFEQAMTHTVDWYKANANWWMPIKNNCEDFNKHD